MEPIHVLLVKKEQNKILILMILCGALLVAIVILVNIVMLKNLVNVVDVRTVHIRAKLVKVHVPLVQLEHIVKEMIHQMNVLVVFLEHIRNMKVNLHVLLVV